MKVCYLLLFYFIGFAVCDSNSSTSSTTNNGQTTKAVSPTITSTQANKPTTTKQTTLSVPSTKSTTASKVTKVNIIATEAPTVALDYHVTMFTIYTSSPLLKQVNLKMVSDDPEVAYPLDDTVVLTEKDCQTPHIVYVFGKSVGSTKIKVKELTNTSQIQDINKIQVTVTIVNDIDITGVSTFIGWIYFLAWSISFYPQAFENFRRRSVVGLNFDFLLYNITGFLSYGFFNIGLYYSTTVQAQYFEKFPGSVIPVQPNDVFFCIHAVILTIITIAQCFIYDRGDQKISKLCLVLTGIAWAFALISLIPAGLGKITWYTYLTYFSYIKLGVTLIKYIPQAVMNYRRKSTVGWSIGNVLLDFTGGSLSIVQMFMIAYNNAEWNSIFGDFTKFALGFFSVCFDIFFMLQHYVFYRSKQPSVYKTLEEDDVSPTNAASTSIGYPSDSYGAADAN